MEPTLIVIVPGVKLFLCLKRTIKCVSNNCQPSLPCFFPRSAHLQPQNLISEFKNFTAILKTQFPQMDVAFLPPNPVSTILVTDENHSSLHADFNEIPFYFLKNNNKTVSKKYGTFLNFIYKYSLESLNGLSANAYNVIFKKKRLVPRLLALKLTVESLIKNNLTDAQLMPFNSSANPHTTYEVPQTMPYPVDPQALNYGVPVNQQAMPFAVPVDHQQVMPYQDSIDPQMMPYNSAPVDHQQMPYPSHMSHQQQDMNSIGQLSPIFEPTSPGPLMEEPMDIVECDPSSPGLEKVSSGDENTDIDLPLVKISTEIPPDCFDPHKSEEQLSIMYNLLNNASNLSKDFTPQFTQLIFIGKKTLLDPMKNLDLKANFIPYNLVNFSKFDVDSILRKIQPLDSQAICCLVFDLSLVTKTFPVSPGCSKFACKDNISTSEFAGDPLNYHKKINERVQQVLSFMTMLGERIPCVVLPLVPVQVVCDKTENLELHQFSHSIKGANGILLSGKESEWRDSILPSLNSMWKNMVCISHENFDSFDFVNKFAEIKGNTFPIRQSSKDIQNFWFEGLLWNAAIEHILQYLVPRKRLDKGKRV